MRAIEYTNKASNTMLRLLYCTCTNDLIINSKQASIIENFIFAFFIEFHRNFILDSFFMDFMKKHLILKTKMYLDFKKSLYNFILIENKNGVLNFWNRYNRFGQFYKIRVFEKSNSLN